MVLPARTKSRVKSIVTFDGELTEAFAPMAVTLTLEDEVDASRGDVLVHVGNIPRVSDRFEAMVVWMAEEPLVPGKQYLFRQSNKTSPGCVATVRYQIDVNTLHRQESPTLRLNQIGRCGIRLTQSFVYDSYQRNRMTGSFIIIDRLSNRTVGSRHDPGPSVRHGRECPLGGRTRQRTTPSHRPVTFLPPNAGPFRTRAGDGAPHRGSAAPARPPPPTPWNACCSKRDEPSPYWTDRTAHGDQPRPGIHGRSTIRKLAPRRGSWHDCSMNDAG